MAGARPAQPGAVVRRGGPDTALSVWVVEQQEVTGETLTIQSLLFLRHPDIQSDVWATPPQAQGTPPAGNGTSVFPTAEQMLKDAMSKEQMIDADGNETEGGMGSLNWGIDCRTGRKTLFPGSSGGIPTPGAPIPAPVTPPARPNISQEELMQWILNANTGAKAREEARHAAQQKAEKDAADTVEAAKRAEAIASSNDTPRFPVESPNYLRLNKHTEPSLTHIDIGGLGYYNNAINVNPVIVDDGSIPNLRLYRGEEMSENGIAPRSVDIITVENTPMSSEMTDEISRAIAEGGMISLSSRRQYMDTNVIWMENSLKSRNIPYKKEVRRHNKDAMQVVFTIGQSP